MIKKQLKIESGNLLLHGVLVTPDLSTQRGVIFFHGGGHSNSERYLKIQERMSDNGIISLAFDFRGCGKSEGNFSKSTLVDRLEDANYALKYLMSATDLIENQIFLWGSSMGGHIAARLCAKHPNLAGVIFQSAAAYGIEAENIPFGPEFTDKLNEIGSWHNSLAFSSLEKFSGRKLVIYGANDDVIPKDIQEKYQSLTPIKNIHFLEDGIHSMLRPQTTIQQHTCEQMLNLSINFILQR